MGHYQAMEAIKSLVPKSVHHEINHHSTVVNSIQTPGNNQSHRPPPAINQAQACQMMQSNLDINVEKGYPMHKAMQDLNKSFGTLNAAQGKESQ